MANTSPRNNGQQNDPKDTHKDAQIFKPPYLFRAGSRPEILSAPDDVTYGQTFNVTTSDPGQVGQVNWLRLSSVTHSFNVEPTHQFLEIHCAARPGFRSRPRPTPMSACPATTCSSS